MKTVGIEKISDRNKEDIQKIWKAIGASTENIKRLSVTVEKQTNGLVLKVFCLVSVPTILILYQLISKMAR